MSLPTTSVPVTPRTSRQEVHTLSARSSVIKRLVAIWKYRELLYSLVRKELKIKYKDSVLGFLWTLLNPALRLGVFYVIFQIVFNNGIPLFAIFFLSGLLVWTLFSEGLAAATGSVVGNSAIVKKVAFPREILPLASVGASVVNFFLQMIVLLIALVGFQHAPSLEHLILLPLALLAVVLLTGAIGLLLSALNVALRDIGHFLEMALLVWFWSTPIVYPATDILVKFTDRGLPEWIYMLNPLVPVVMAFQRAIWNIMEPLNGRDGRMGLPDESILWFAGHLGIVIAVAGVIFFGAMVVFGRREGNFAEEL